MAHFAYDFVHCPCSKAFEADQSMVKRAFEIMHIENPHPTWPGIQIGEPTYWNVTAWENSAAHKAFTTSAVWPAFWEAIAPVTANPANTGAVFFHGHFPTDPAPALDAPLTQITQLAPKAGKTRADIEELVVRMLKLMDGDGVDGVRAAFMGTIEEHPQNVVVLIGWESKELQEKASGPDGPAGAILKEASDTAEATSALTKLTKH
ncbi:hypothetical protein K488DRAFT_89307 [Vararia minispora EC-137]|uniref:Uncharacterized protein n=1 Tax=Vararia minispora EC-137 TaxID=1314806 RepID=A0ACB8QAN8_9AGAM|nr:hypothetical protein K488DRAFT_89307 [Vararia minispora EC-137]